MDTFFDEDIEDFVKNHSDIYKESFKKGFQRGEKKGFIFTLKDKGLSMRETAMVLTEHFPMNFPEALDFVKNHWEG